MTITYLKDAETLQELKKLYFKMAKEYHPDHGGDTETMKQINNEYDYLQGILPNQKPKTDDEKIFTETVESMGIYKEVISELMKYRDITIEIVGSWVWVFGKGTFAIKDNVLYEKLNFKYSKGQKKFYWFNGIENQKWRPRGGYLKQAKEKYNVITFESEGLLQLV